MPMKNAVWIVLGKFKYLQVTVTLKATYDEKFYRVTVRHKLKSATNKGKEVVDFTNLDEAIKVFKYNVELQLSYPTKEVKVYMQTCISTQGD